MPGKQLVSNMFFIHQNYFTILHFSNVPCERQGGGNVFKRRTVTIFPTCFSWTFTSLIQVSSPPACPLPSSPFCLSPLQNQLLASTHWPLLPNSRRPSVSARAVMVPLLLSTDRCDTAKMATMTPWKTMPSLSHRPCQFAFA